MMGMDAKTVQGWGVYFDRLMEQVGPCFRRCDLRKRASAYVRGLLGPVQRKNSWQLAEHVGDATPHGVQRLLDRARWDADQVGDELIRYARTHLLTEGDHGVLIVDETGFLKKGDQSVGVQRQYSGTAGRIENCQIGVFLALVGPRGRALIDRELYLPKSWCADEERLRAARVPEAVRFATKPQLAQRMMDRAWCAGLCPRWVLGDEVYGSDGKFRRSLESHGQPYVLAVSGQQRLWNNLRQQRVDQIADTIPSEAWLRISVAEGAKGPRVYDWAAGRYGARTDHGLVRWLLIRRRVEDPTERAYYLCTAPPEATVQDLAMAAGQRWGIECCFESAKQETGLDHYEVRSWHGWYRHMTLSMLGLALLGVIRAEATAPRANHQHQGRETKQKKMRLIWCH
jgi:SRSO17 transposase